MRLEWEDPSVIRELIVVQENDAHGNLHTQVTAINMRWLCPACGFTVNDSEHQCISSPDGSCICVVP